MHVAFMAVPAHGHINPSLALVAELVRRGHRVTFTVRADFADAVSAAGAEPLLHESTFPSGEQDWPDNEVGAQRLFHDEFLAVYPQVEALYAGEKPDVVVYDIGAWHAPVLAAKWGVPAVQLSPTYVAFEGWREYFGLNSEVRPEIAAMDTEFADFVAAQGVSLTVEEIKHSPRRCIVTIPRSWQIRGDTVGPDYTFVGPSIDEREHQGKWTPPAGKKILLISLGSAYTNRLDFYRACVTAFADLNDWHVLLSVGKFIDPAALGTVPAHIEVVQWVPQVNVLATATAFITHAGMGSTMEALHFAVPMIAIPQAVDQFLNAPRIAELGLGTHLPLEDATPTRLLADLHHITTDPTIATNLANFRTTTQSSGGPTKAADIIESLT
ncbi:glycosyltransferase, MGT family [Actinokineospora globicatena]|nr:macrolide family glycosyltransferase [Actinokineospora globicatena]MCP2301132.1 glycosyltransferase, MGT family [Actinokineospora globicatena]GLW77232.1 UDP glycosyltransferase [Actinokineospora globicatena]GLW84066.1 UDP glycosyltransferase [Actinokineospora globicatena]